MRRLLLRVARIGYVRDGAPGLLSDVLGERPGDLEPLGVGDPLSREAVVESALCALVTVEREEEVVRAQAQGVDAALEVL
jgi:hypothetical protein